MINLLYPSNNYSDPIVALFSSIVILIIIGVAIDIILCVLAVKIAEKNGRNGTAWAALVLFFGLIPFIVLLCLNKKADIKWVCKKCGSVNSNGDYCTNCGNSNLTENYNTPWACPTCGQRNKSNSQYCCFCGQKRP